MAIPIAKEIYGLFFFHLQTSFMLRTTLNTFQLQWVSEWLLLSANSAFFLVISWREQVNFQCDADEVRFVLDQHAELDFYSASSLKQQSAIDMSLYSDTLFWFRANQYLLFLLNAVCLEEKQHISIS